MTRRPNVLILMTDQHRADMMTCAGNDLVPTPNMDRIAARGVRFENAYCPYPVCTASRMSFLTGLYAHTTGAINNPDRLDWRYRTMADHFAAHGYHTALIGKMHFNDAHNHGFQYYLSINDWLMYLGPKVPHVANEIASHPLNDGFFRSVQDTGSGFPDVRDLWDEESPWVGNVERYPTDSTASRLAAEDHLDAFVAREAAKFLKAQDDTPFLLVASFMKPHPPFFPPAEWAAQYPPEDVDLAPVGDTTQYPEHIRKRIAATQGVGEARIRAYRAGYLGNLAFVDTCVGTVLDALDASGHGDDTIVAYTSDHGEMGGDHGIYQKFCMFEPAVKVPLIVGGPGLPQGRVTDALTEYLGLYPTLCELTGTGTPDGTTIAPMAGAPSKLDARSFADVVRSPESAGPETAFSEFGLRGKVPQYLMRTRTHKLVYNDGGSRHELYDLVEDPDETVNRIDDPDCAALRDDLEARLREHYDPDTNPYRGD